MLPQLIHAALLYGVPLVLGGLLGALTRLSVPSTACRVLAGVATAIVTVLVEYGLFFVFSLWMTQTPLEPAVLSFDTFVAGLLWFALLATFTAVPTALAAFVCGLCLSAPVQKFVWVVRRATVRGPPGAIRISDRRQADLGQCDRAFPCCEDLAFGSQCHLEPFARSTLPVTLPQSRGTSQVTALSNVRD